MTQEMTQGMRTAKMGATGRLSLTLAADALSSASLSEDGLTGGLLPEASRLELALDQINLRTLADTLAATQRSGSVDDDLVLAQDFEAAAPQFLAWVLGSGIVIDPDLSYASALLNMTGDGDLLFGGPAGLGLGGSYSLRIEDFAALQARISEAQISGDVQDQGFGQPTEYRFAVCARLWPRG